ncbi:hypothetical protein [Parvibaculum sp.]|uniref:5' nucleotidase, NT5C type n=1 Tax=Parvibaculum sp. TaxID=2024848 RepID=UPI002733F3E5|nr:hypothetical protein [Parvibaculum sp.]MDP3328732.1 hypothetical protein [Parvibaculum sp.]
MPRIYLDMDGVLADFDAGLRALGIEPNQTTNKSRSHMTPDEIVLKDKVYDAILAQPFFNTLPLMHDAQVLWDFCAPFEPVILTAAPSRESGFEKAAREKREWIEEHFGPIPDERFICTNSSKKRNYVGHLPGSKQVLVDDRASNVTDWIAAGGTGILHLSAVSSLRVLKFLLHGEKAVAYGDTAA